MAWVVEGYFHLLKFLIALFLAIMVALVFGNVVSNSSEAAVVAAVYSLVVAVFIYGELKLSELYAVFVTAAKTTRIIMFLVAAALVSAWLIPVSEIATSVVDLLKPFMGNQTLLLIAIMVLVVIVGTAMDMTPTILILMPVVKAAGIDPVYFGVLFIVNNSIGLITPPVGTVLNVVAGVSNVSMEDLIKGVWPFLLTELAVLFLIILFPSLVMVPAKWFAGGPDECSRYANVQEMLKIGRYRYDAYEGDVRHVGRRRDVSARRGERRDQGTQTAVRIPERAGTSARARKAFQRQLSRDSEAKTVETLKAQGMQIVELKPEEVARLREKTKPVADKFIREASEPVVKELFAELEKIRARK